MNNPKTEKKPNKKPQNPPQPYLPSIFSPTTNTTLITVVYLYKDFF